MTIRYTLCACEVLSPQRDACRTPKPLTLVKSGYIASAISSITAMTGNSDVALDAEAADQCSTLVLDTLPWKRIRISLVGLYSRNQPFR